MTLAAKVITSLSIRQITDGLKEMNEPSFRARQIAEWIYRKNARNITAVLQQEGNGRNCGENYNSILICLSAGISRQTQSLR